MLHSPLDLPARGASVMQPAGVSGVLIPANTLGPEVRFRWPFRTMIRAMILTERSGDPAVLANIALSIHDQANKLITADGQGQALFENPSATQGFGPSLVTPGWGSGRPIALQRLVQSGDIWTFQLANQNAATEVTPELTFFFATVKAP